MNATAHEYEAALRWDGNTGAGTADYRSYERRFAVRIPGKPELIGSADPKFRGDAGLHNPEELLVAALASCHMLAYLALCARRGVRVVEYRDAARGTMRLDERGGGRFERVVLAPRVVIAAGQDAALARELHERAHEACFIASSCNFPVEVQPQVMSEREGSEREVGELRAREPAAPALAGIDPVRRDLAVRLPHRPGALAELGETLGRAGISLEGGGGFVVGDPDACEHGVVEHGIVRFLVADAARAAEVVRAAGLEVIGVRDVLVQRLDQETPGQLGKLARAMADAGVNIECVYSDHEHALILCVDDPVAGARVSEAWRASSRDRRGGGAR